jgi:predicted phosphodiesterase
MRKRPRHITKREEYRLIQDLAKIFEEHGKVLSKREYLRLKWKPYSLEAYECVFGWGRAKHLAAEMIGGFSPPSGSCDPAYPPKTDTTISRTAPFAETPEDEETAFRLAMMTGLKKQSLPTKYREMIGKLIMSVEKCLLELPKTTIRKPSVEKESVCLLVSDIHSGKQAYDDQGECLYSKDICAFRLNLLKQRTLHLLNNHLRPERLDEFVLCLAGDIVDGSGIYPNQELHQDLTNFNHQIALVVAGIWDLILAIRKMGLIVRVRGVRGNHGRQHKYAPATNNFDYLVYQLLYLMAHYEDQEGIEVKYSATTDYLNFTVKGHKVHMRHEAPTQPETPSARAKFGGWRALHDWRVFLYGHKHHPGSGTYLDGDTFMNGSIVGIDDLAESLATYSRPSQTLFGVDAEVGVSFRYNVYLDQFGKGGEADELLERYPMLRAA